MIKNENTREWRHWQGQWPVPESALASRKLLCHIV